MKRLVSIVIAAAAGIATSCGANMGVPPGSKLTAAQRALLPVCPATPAPMVFGGALCACEDVKLTGSGIFAAPLDNTAANVGVNGSLDITGHHDVGGTLVAYMGATGTGHLTVRDSMLSTKDISGAGRLEVGKNLFVGGNLDHVGRIDVGGQLAVAGSMNFCGSTRLPAPNMYSAPKGLPCDCTDKARLNFENAFAQARQNATNLGAKFTSNGSAAMTLKTGRYILGDVSKVGRLDLTIDGAVALFIDGSLDAVGLDQFKVGPGSTLDVYVRGDVRKVGRFNVGREADLGAVRLYIGGANPVSFDLTGRQDMTAMIYAPTADMQLTGSTHIKGSLFVKSLVGTGRLEIGHAAPAQPDIDTCRRPDEPVYFGENHPTPGGGSGGGSGSSSGGGSGSSSGGGDGNGSGGSGGSGGITEGTGTNPSGGVSTGGTNPFDGAKIDPSGTDPNGGSTSGTSGGTTTPSGSGGTSGGTSGDPAGTSTTGGGTPSDSVNSGGTGGLS